MPQAKWALVGEGGGVGDDDERFSGSGVKARKLWLLAGGKTGRIIVLELMDFVRPKP